MSVMFAARLDKSLNAQRLDGKFPIVLEVTWDRKVGRKRLGIFAFEHQFTICEDKRRKVEKALLSNMNSVQVYQDHIDDELQRVKGIYQEYFDGKAFNYNRFIDNIWFNLDQSSTKRLRKE